MFNLNFSITNPWSNRWEVLFFKNGTLGKHRAWEFNGYSTHSLIDIDVRISHRCDHAGLHTIIGLLGLALEFSIYDTRHWNYDKDNWEIYP
jgi:hypothetical protein